MEHTVNAFGVWADVAPDKFVLMLQGFKTGGCLGCIGSHFGLVSDGGGLVGAMHPCF